MAKEEVVAADLQFTLDRVGRRLAWHLAAGLASPLLLMALHGQEADTDGRRI